MQITAKFNGKCRLCQGSLPKGSRIEWSRNAGAQHLQCDPNTIIEDGKTLEQLADEWDREFRINDRLWSKFPVEEKEQRYSWIKNA